jgi:hypothetical protein
MRVALVPKKEHPTDRPFTVDVIGPSQSAFLPGRNISDAILLAQELLHNYHHNKGLA